MPADPPGLDITYEIEDSATLLKVQKPFAVYTPGECVYDLIFSVSNFATGGPLPSFLTFTEQNGFHVRSSNPADFGVY